MSLNEKAESRMHFPLLALTLRIRAKGDFSDVVTVVLISHMR